MKLSFQPAACVVLAFAILILPIQWLLSWILAAWFHELCHYLMIRMTGGRVLKVKLGIFGAEMIADIPLSGREVLCALAGPLGGMLLLLLVRIAPRVALCAFVQSACNLLPVYPLDGGRILYGLLKRCRAKSADCVMGKITFAVLLLLLLLAVWAAVCRSLGILPVAAVIVLIIKARKNTLQRRGIPGTIVLPDISRGKL